MICWIVLENLVLYVEAASLMESQQILSIPDESQDNAAGETFCGHRSIALAPSKLRLKMG